MTGGPFCDIGMKALAVLHYWREESQFAAAPSFPFQLAAQFIAGLGLDGQIAVGTILGPEPGEQQADEVINFGDRRDGALAAATAGSLLDADGRRDAGDQVN